MQLVNRKLASWLIAVTLATTHLTYAPTAAASVDDYESASNPSAGAVFFDSLVVRPVGLVGMVAGTAVFIVSLPFSALGGNVKEVADEMVVAPTRYTFVRPIGEF
jgi:hypothetical protein